MKAVHGSSIVLIALILLSLCVPSARSDAAVLQASGKVTLLRVHDVGTAFGPPSDQIDVEVVFRLDSQPMKAFGFQLRNDSNAAAHRGMLDLLRDAFNHGWTVTTDYRVDDPQSENNGVAIRVWLTGNLQGPVAYQYSAKFVCGRSDGKILPLGTYFTAINVHNPADTALSLSKQFVVALPGEKAGPVSGIIEARLNAGQAFEIDCADIFEHTGTDSFAKGFVSIKSREDLEVVGVYAAARVDDDQVVSEEIERVPPRVIPVKLPDLVPLPDAAGSFCRLSGNRLLVTVANRGSARAAESTTEVDFLNGTKTTAATSALDPGGSIDLLFGTPAGFQSEGTHNFLITTDLLSQVAEESEANNFATGQCIFVE
jgi:CARDB